MNHIQKNNLMAQEQMGCRQSSQGCKELLVVDSFIASQVSKKSRNISLSWIDYQKAYDSVPHDWLIEVLKIYKVDQKVVELLNRLMGLLKISLVYPTRNDSVSRETIPIKRGIFQGDTLSPLWFYLALNPLSSILNQTDKGYSLNQETKVSHSFYMDDLKLYAKNERDMRSLLEMVVTYSEDIGMKLGTEKCATLNIQRGKYKNAENIELSNNDIIKQLKITDSYKYLGFSQLLKFKKEVKETFDEEFKKRVKKLLKTSLSAGNMVRALNTWALPAVTYSFGVLKWSNTDLEKMDRFLRTEMTKSRQRHPKSSVPRLYLPRKLGGRGLVSLLKSCRDQEARLRAYFVNSGSHLLSTIAALDRGYTALNILEQEQAVMVTEESITESWKCKPLHGRFYNSLKTPGINHEASVCWLTKGKMFPETEGFLMAIQEQTVATRSYRRYIIHEAIDDRCRLCKATNESIQHVTSGCQALTGKEYLARHNNAAKIVHQALAQKYKLINSHQPFYKYQPQSTLDNEEAKLYWDQTMITDHNIPHNRPDILLITKKIKKAIIVEVGVPADDNVPKTISEKIRKYQELCEELKQLYRLEEVKVLPVVISCNGLIPEETVTSLKALDICRELPEIQKAVILGTATIVRKFLNISN